MIRLTKIKRFRDERGFVTVEFVAGAALIILPTLMLISVFPTWFERVSMARVASREAARVLVLTGDQAQAQAAADTIRNNYNLPEDELEVSFTGDPKVRGGSVTATVTTRIPATIIPVLGLDTGVIPITADHTEVVDQFRSIPQ